MSDGEALLRPRKKDFRLRKPVISDLLHPLTRDPIVLTASRQRAARQALAEVATVARPDTSLPGTASLSPVSSKWNAGDQSIHRTQGRARVTQALARVRKAAQQRRKEKFTALFHHISVDLLREAFFVLKRDAAPGIDGLAWQTYATDLEQNLTDLHAPVH